MGGRSHATGRAAGLALLLVLSFGGSVEGAPAPSTRSLELAERAVADHADDAVALLADLMAFETVHVEGTPNAENPHFRTLTAYLQEEARRRGFDMRDHGAAVVLGLGDAEERLGVIVHADVQPADPSEWARSPYSLDRESEPGRLVGRGAEDDKGPLALALTAMRTLAEAEVPLTRRIELFVAYTEESDWGPLQALLADYDPPGLNVALDSNYPVVTAEKGWCALELYFAPVPVPPDPGEPSLRSLSGGAFLSQVPENAEAVIASASEELELELRRGAAAQSAVGFEFERRGDELVVRARGRAAHSGAPWNGTNAITHLAALLATREWPDTSAARLVRLTHDLIGTGDYAERFGDVAYSHPFMGPLTLTLATVAESDGELVAGINLRRPMGRTRAQVETSLRSAVDAWRERSGVTGLRVETRLDDPYMVEDAPHVPVLLDVFRHFTGREDAEPIAIGGGTNARLFPGGVSFGPAMPDVEYTGHTEHEFMTEEQFRLNLRMYTALLAELAAGDGAP